MKNKEKKSKKSTNLDGQFPQSAAPLSQAVRETLCNIRLNFRVPYKEFARLAGVTQPTVINAMRLQLPIRDTIAFRFLKLVEQFNAGTLKFENGKGVEKQ